MRYEENEYENYDENTKQELHEFLDFLDKIPMWVKDEDDLIKYSRHIKYRLEEYKKYSKHYEKELDKLYKEGIINSETLEKILNDADKIYIKCSKWYENKDPRDRELDFTRLINERISNLDSADSFN